MTNYPLRIAHRGMPRLAPENTLPSFALALEAGADGIELDVHATKDGVVVVHHDPELARGMVIAQESFATLHSAAEDVPTLADVCDLVAGRAELFVEIKGAGIEHEVLEVMGNQDGPFAIHSFDHALIARISTIDSAIRLGVLFEESPADVSSLMATTGARDLWPHAPLVTAPLLASVHDAGGRLIAWTVNSPVEAQRLADMGVDGLCGDDVRMFTAQ
jgi:glycerophosphoryl diester phosphodiesterase